MRTDRGNVYPHGRKWRVRFQWRRVTYYLGLFRFEADARRALAVKRRELAATVGPALWKRRD